MLVTTWSAATNSDGWYSLPLAPTGPDATLVVERDGFAAASTTLAAARPYQHVTLTRPGTVPLDTDAAHGGGEPVGVVGDACLEGCLGDEHGRPRAGRGGFDLPTGGLAALELCVESVGIVPLRVPLDPESSPASIQVTATERRWLTGLVSRASRRRTARGGWSAVERAAPPESEAECPWRSDMPAASALSKTRAPTKLTRMRVLTNHHVLAVPDLERSRRWYERMLGCRADDVDPGNWVFMHRDAVVFQLGRCPDAIAVPDLGDHQYFAYLVVDDVDAFHARAVAGVGEAGGEVLGAPQDRPWGMREFALRTVDGHRLMVASNIGRPSRAWPGPDGSIG